MRNLDVEHGVANGTRAVVTEIGSYSVVVRLLRNRRIFTVPRVSCVIEVNGKRAVRRQFPLRLGYAITVHAAQGKTISRAVFDSRGQIFSHGQLYVALSRCKLSKDLLIVYETAGKQAELRELQSDGVLVRNIIYPALLKIQGAGNHQLALNRFNASNELIADESRSKRPSSPETEGMSYNIQPIQPLQKPTPRDNSVVPFPGNGTSCRDRCIRALLSNGHSPSMVTHCQKCRMPFCILAKALEAFLSGESVCEGAASIYDLKQRAGAEKIDYWSIVDVPGDGNCWVYAASLTASFLVGSGIPALEPGHLRKLLGAFVANLSPLSLRTGPQHFYQLIRSNIMCGDAHHLYSDLAQILQLPDAYHAVAAVIRVSIPHKCTWTDNIGSELSMLATILRCRIISVGNRDQNVRFFRRRSDPLGTRQEVVLLRTPEPMFILGVSLPIPLNDSSISLENFDSYPVLPLRFVPGHFQSLQPPSSYSYTALHDIVNTLEVDVNISFAN